MIGDKFEHFSRYLLRRNKTTETVKDWQTDRWTLLVKEVRWRTLKRQDFVLHENKKYVCICYMYVRHFYALFTIAVSHIFNNGGARLTTRPCDISRIRSASATVSVRWAMTRTVQELNSWRNVCWMCPSVSKSTLAVAA